LVGATPAATLTSLTRLRSTLATLALVLGARGAAAQTTEVTPPSAVDAGHVVYPAEAHGDASVVLDLVIEKDGRVGDVIVVDGDEPFVTAALAAARTWTFTPAHRGDIRISARVRMRLDFHPPAPAPAPAPVNVNVNVNVNVPVPVPARPPTPAPTPGVEEVHVHGTRTEVGETQLGGAEVRQMPGAFGDAFRAIEALPGVTPLVSGLPFFFVRGAPPGNVGYFLDGVRIPLLFHLALGPSVVHPGLIDHVDFFPGGYPARFGRFSGGILDGETLAPATHVHAEGNVRLFDAGVLAEAPLLDDRMTALVAGRYSYTSALVQLFAKNTRVGYWDYQARVAYRLSSKDSVSIFWFGSFDEIDNRDQQTVYDPNGNVTGQSTGPFYPVFKTEFHRLDLRYDHDTPHGHLRLAATLGLEDSVAGTSVTQQTGVAASTAGLRVEGEERLSPFAKLRYGSDVLFTHYSLDTGSPSSTSGDGFGTSGPPPDATTSSSSASALQSLYPARNDVMIGSYADVVWKATPRIELVPGMRLDVFTSRLAPGASADAPSLPGTTSSSTATLAPEPRLAARVVVTPKLTSITTFGIAHQPPSLFVPIPGLTLGSLATGLQTSIQTSQGVELDLPLDFKLTTTGFLHEYLGLSDATATCLGNGTNVPSAGDSCLAEQVNGRAYGIELLARRDLTRRLTGWVSYTLSRSERQTHGIGGTEGSTPTSGLAGLISPSTALQWIPAEFDRTHVLNVVGAMDLGRQWRAGVRFFLYTGRPYSPSVQGVPVAPYNSERLPTFYRVDVRVEKRWRAFGNGYVAFVIEGMNVTLKKEAIAAQCQSDGTLYPLKYDSCAPEYIGPVSVPSVGVEAGY
jgi:TonB family protein